MTVPGGVPNLPAAALTLETLGQKLQDQTVGTIRTLASQRMPSIFDGSTGGTILSDLSPFGIITHLWAGFVSTVGNADPADIDGPEDLPGLLLDFIEGLPIIGNLVGLLEAILGTYDGHDPVLLAVQEIFFPIRKLLQLITGQGVGFPTVDEITAGWVHLGPAIAEQAEQWATFLAATGQESVAAVAASIATTWATLNWLVAQVQFLLGGAGKTALGDLGSAIAANEAKIEALIHGSVGSGGSGFPWTFPVAFGTGSGFPWSFPVSFGTVEISIDDVATSILTGPEQGLQDLKNTLVRAATGVESQIDHSLGDVRQIFAQLPQLPPLAVVKTGLEDAAETTGQVGAIITNSLQADAAAVGGFLATAGWNAAGAVGQLEDAAENALGGLQAAASPFGQALAVAVGGWLSAWTGAPAAPAPASAFQSAQAAAARQLVDNAAGLVALNALLTQASNGGGLSVNVGLAAVADGALPAAFTSPKDPHAGDYPDTLTIHSGSAVDNSGVGGLALYNAAVTGGDQQLITGIFSGVTGSNVPVLVGRSNTAGNSLVYAQYSAANGGWGLQCYVGGSLQSPFIFGAFAPDTFTNGAAYSLVCGTGAVGNRVFQIWKNGSPLALFDNSLTPLGSSYTDSGNVSQMGASYRSGGFGLVGSAQMSTWTFVDNTPPAAVGSGFVAYRAATGAASATAASPSSVTLGSGAVWSLFKFNASCFDTTQYQTSDVSYSSSTNTLTVGVSGWYKVDVSMDIVWAGTSANGVVLYKNGTLYKLGSAQLAGTGNAPQVSSSFTIYCAAGDTLTPGCMVNGAGFTGPYGDAGGLGTYWSVSFMNRGTLS